VTIHNNHKISFGDLINGKMMLNKFGHVVRHEWKRSAKIRREINLDGFIILPNHFHAIIHIVGANSRSPLRMEPKSLSSLIAGFKSSTTVHINNMTKKYGISTWQRGFYDRVIRSESELWYKREYIRNNPLKHWKQTFSL
jgi:REP element-mobilizing transposase RayT